MENPLEILHSLGQTPDEIAAKLHLLNIEGIKGNPASCPLTKYMQKQGFRYFQAEHDKYYLGNSVEGEMPKPCQEFVINFDNGEYWYLEDWGRDYD